MGKISVKVKPGSKKIEVKKEGNVFRISVHARPEKGKANKELIDFLSRALGVPKSSIKIVVGNASRTKIIEIIGLETEEIERRLSAL